MARGLALHGAGSSPSMRLLHAPTRASLLVMRPSRSWPSSTLLLLIHARLPFLASASRVWPPDCGGGIGIRQSAHMHDMCTISTCVYVCMYVCMHECMHVMYVCTHVSMYVCMSCAMCVYVCMYACAYVRMYVCTYVRIHVRMHVCTYICVASCKSLAASCLGVARSGQLHALTPRVRNGAAVQTISSRALCAAHATCTCLARWLARPSVKCPLETRVRNSSRPSGSQWQRKMAYA
jgi:hypothetical protein